MADQVRSHHRLASWLPSMTGLRLRRKLGATRRANSYVDLISKVVCGDD